MSAGLAIDWRGLSAATQDRLARDAWLLTGWWVVVGVACSRVLLELFHLRSPLLRYPVTALVMYGVGVVAGTRLWLAAAIALFVLLPEAVSLADIYRR